MEPLRRAVRARAVRRLSTIGSFSGTFGKMRSSQVKSRRLSVRLYKNRSAEIRISTVLGSSFFGCSRKI